MANTTDEKKTLAAVNNAGELDNFTGRDKAGLAQIAQDHTIPEDGSRKTTTTLEYWSYCLYNLGATGVGLGNYGGALQQDLVESAFPNGTLFWGGKTTTTTSFILDLNGITFAVQLVVLLFLGPYADYGHWRPWILIFWTVVGIVASFVFLDFTDSSKWALCSGFYVLGTLAVNTTNSFWTAAFPTLVRDLPQMQESERQVVEGLKNPDEHAVLDMLERSRLSNWSYIFQGLGSAALIILALAICYGIGHTTDEQNNKVYYVVTAYFGGIWILTALPWFFADQHRPGMKLPDNTNWLLVGPKQVWEAAKNVTHLKNTFLYILAYFLLTDSNSTSGYVVQILQNNAINFDTVTYSGLYAIVYGGTGIGVLLQLWVQRRWKITPKTMYIYNSALALTISLWGMIGNWTTGIGFYHTWEFWLYQAWNGFASAGGQSYASILMAEVAPGPKMYIFFALFNTVGRTSSFVGPFIVGAIVDDAGGNNQRGFYFTFFLGLVGLVLLFFVNVDKAKADNAKYLEKEREDLYASHGSRDVAVEVVNATGRAQSVLS